MPHNIKNPETERLARDLARQTGKNITTAIRVALEERLHRIASLSTKSALHDDLVGIRLRCADLPVLDDCAVAEIIEYDQHGLPTPDNLSPLQKFP